MCRFATKVSIIVDHISYLAFPLFALKSFGRSIIKLGNLINKAQWISHGAPIRVRVMKLENDSKTFCQYQHVA